MYSDHELQRLSRSLREYDQMIFRTRILTILTETGLRFLSLKTIEWLFSCFTKKSISTDHIETVVIIDKYTTIFNQMNQRTSLKGRCLSQSLVMRFLLSRKGISSELKIGISHATGQFDAHAWLERDGILLNDHPAVIAKYVVLPVVKLNSSLKIK